ncbi:hypothetical protein LOK49_LG04G03263 [Camellia lanceoleosa]|uniref:Uncharacterized protein n=1 Tax=Camellia lanceoleosa TaxID=1840588 RepID=A0ACC0HUA1_9ERIC|nr:hypothetical protein LOK49_LG04G03263 [Camellia lanceoleosa]
MDSMASMPSGAGKIPRLNAVILGEALASEDDDLVFPSDHFSTQALIPSPQKYLEMYRRSIEDPAAFWSDIASEFYWKQRWGQEIYLENLDIRKGKIKIEWIKGAATAITDFYFLCGQRPKEKLIDWKSISDASLCLLEQNRPD